jgi:hypothetical protein
MTLKNPKKRMFIKPKYLNFYFEYIKGITTTTIEVFYHLPSATG